MTFLQPFILLALPLIGLPILIHLVNQNRHRTVHWGATMFLIQARRMARGMARLRYWLIMLARMLAMAGLIFAVSRPMAGGWLGVTAGGSPETTLILLDRSLSMETHHRQTRLSKRQTALNKLSELIDNIGGNTQLVLFDSAGSEHLTIQSASDLPDLPQAGPTATTADLPDLLRRASEYINANQTGRTDVWICSDLQKSDWDPSGGRWESVRRQLSRHEGVRIYLLAYPQEPRSNLAVRASGVHRRVTSEGVELLMDLKITRTGDTSQPVDVPIGIVIDGARSTLSVSMAGSDFSRNGHAIPIDQESVAGWGRIELPDDDNPADNIFRFVYAEPPARQTVVVSDTPAVAEYQRLAAGTSSDRSQMAEAMVIAADAVDSIDWDHTSMIIWHAGLPFGSTALQLQEFVESGRTILFFPPDGPSDNALFGCSWGDWQTADQPVKAGRWRTESDLLANARSGAPLPVGDLDFSSWRSLTTEQGSVLASLDGGAPLLVRAWSDHGAVWFCTSTPSDQHSTMIDNGIVFYVMIQRALARGTAALGNAQQVDSGTLPIDVVTSWAPLDDLSRHVLVSSRSHQAGLYRDEDVRFALNRPVSEDSPLVVGDEVLASLFDGLDFMRLDDTAGSTQSLASEVWRIFLMFMILALLAEALLCVPERRVVSTESAAISGFADRERTTESVGAAS